MEMPTPLSKGTDQIEILVKMTPAELREAIDILEKAKRNLAPAEVTAQDYGKVRYICLALNAAYVGNKPEVILLLKKYFNNSCRGSYSSWINIGLGHEHWGKGVQTGRHLWVQQVIDTMGGWLEPLKV